MRITPETLYPETYEEIRDAYVSRADRATHPSGNFDKAGRWYPDNYEVASCCGHVRSPSRAHPYSYMVHCRTRKHLNTWYLEHVCAPLFRDLMALCDGEKN